MKNYLRYFMGFKPFTLLLMAFLLVNTEGWAQTNITLGGLGTVTCPATPTAIWTTSPSGITISNITRGSGVSCNTYTDGINGSGFDGNLASNLTNAKWYTYDIAAGACTNFQLTELKIQARISNNAASNISVQYSINGGAKTVLGSFSPNNTPTLYTINFSAISVSASQILNIFLVPNSLNASGTTCTIQNGSIVSLTATTASPTTPTFNTVSPICSGATLSALPTTSINSITGTWSPALNNAATTTYTFTPTAGQCATTTTLTITVNLNPIAYNMTGGGSYCSGGSGVTVGLAGFESDVSYQLKVDGTDTGMPVSGTGSALSFGNQTAAGIYTVLATRGSCTTLITNNGSSAAQLPVNGLMAFYPFSGNANDATSFGNNASTPSGFTVPTSTTDRHGNANMAYLFNGSNTIFQANDAPQLRPKNLTLSHWAYINNNSGIQSMVGKAYASTNCDAYTSFLYNGTFAATSCSAIAQGAFPGNFLNNTTASTGEWKFVTYVFDDDNNTLKLYIDGLLVNSINSWNNPLVYDNTPLQIGAATEEGSVQFYFNGKLDDIRIYNRVLINAEITALFTETPTKITVNNTSVTPSVSIAISSGVNPTCSGSSVTFTAMPTNGGTNPSYQWKKGSTNVGMNSPTYTDEGSTSGSITCVMTVGTGICTNMSSETSTAIPLSIHAACIPVLAAKVFIEGAYNAGTMNGGLRTNGKIPTVQPYNTLTFTGSDAYTGAETSTQAIFDANAIVDWVLIEMRNGTTPSDVVARRAALLQSDGNIVDIDGTSSITFTGLAAGSYHVAIRHRLCLATRTATPISFTNGTTPMVLNFTNNSNALPNSRKELGIGSGVYALYSGDTDRDGDIDAADLINVRARNPTPMEYFEYLKNNCDLNFDSMNLIKDISNVRLNLGTVQVSIY